MGKNWYTVDNTSGTYFCHWLAHPSGVCSLLFVILDRERSDGIIFAALKLFLINYATITFAN
jgi:hypothetical protein